MLERGTITIEGYELTYRIEGNGIPVLVIGSEAFYPPLFSPSIRDRLKLIHINHRGFSRTPRSGTTPITLDVIISDIETIREVLQLKQFILVGHSGHAFMAAAYALKYPKRVRKLVLLNTAPTNSSERIAESAAAFEQYAEPERKQQYEQDMARLPVDIENDPDRRFAHTCIRMAAQSFYDYTYNASPLWEQLYTNMPILDYLWGEAFGQVNLLDQLNALEMPTLLGLGRHDYLVGPVSLWDEIEAKKPLLKKVIFEQSGHYPMLEEPELFNQEFLNWIVS